MQSISASFEAWNSTRTRAELIRLLEVVQQPVFAICLEVLRHRQDAEDLGQKVLLEILHGLDDVKNGDHFARWFRVVAFRSALNAARDRRRRVNRDRKAGDMKPSQVPDEIRESIHEAMAALDEEDRELVIERYFERETLEDMGQRRGITGAAVSKRIETVRRCLREALTVAGFGAIAQQANACLESVIAAPTANLMTSAVMAKATVLGGTVMAGKGTVVAVTTVISIAMFAVGVGGGVAIQAARETSAAVVESTPNSPEPRPVTTGRDSTQVESLRQLVEAQEIRIRELRAAGPDASAPEPAAPTPQELQVKSARVSDLWLRSYRQSLSKEEDAEMLKLYAEIDATWAPYLIDVYKKVADDQGYNRWGMLVLLFCEAGGQEVARFVTDRLKDESCSESERRSLQSHLADPTASYRVLDKTPTTPELALLAQSWITASEPHVRAAGARLLGGVDSADSRAVLTGMLVDANWSTRCAAILALGRAGDAASLSDLIEFRRSRDGTWPDSNEGRAERKAVDRAIRKLQSRLER